MKYLLLSLVFISTLCFATDNPCTATVLTPGAACVNTAGTNVGATNTPAGIAPAPGCASYNGQDVWFQFVVPASGAAQINMTAGTMTDSGMAIYSGPCGGPLTLIECDDDDGTGAMSMINNSTLSPGTTVWIRVWDYGGGTGTFSICVLAVGPCGAPAANNDYCPFPAQLTPGVGNFSATTAATFTQDQPANLTSVFCGSVENNSWYQFTATSNTASIPITVVSGCTFGIQAQVYNVTYNAAGCCTNFTSMSNCYNPGSTALGTVTATGLTVGNQYLLMVDGNGGANCNFTISGWTATGILPIELKAFTGERTAEGNYLSWATESKNNNDYFEVLHSRDGDHFEKIATISGAGTTTTEQFYSFLHQGVGSGLHYYRLKQVDFDGTTYESNIIAIKAQGTNGLYSCFPNPVNDRLSIQLEASKDENMRFALIAADGTVVWSETMNVSSGSSIIEQSMEDMKAGVYTLTIETMNGIHQERIIKN